MLGLCFLAALLAEQRAGYQGLIRRHGERQGSIGAVSRRTVYSVGGQCYLASVEYYQILDCLSRGERP